MTTKTRLLSFIFIAHALVHGAVLSIPLFVPIWLAEFDVTRARIGFVVAILLVFYGAMAIPAGALSDRYGSDRFITLFLLVTGLGFALTRFVGDEFLYLATSLVAVGIGAGMYHAPALSLLSRQDYASSRIFAYHNIGGNLGIALGPVIVILLLAFYDWRLVLPAMAVPFLAFGILFHVAGPTDAAGDARDRDNGDDGMLRSLLTIGFAFIFLVYILRGAFFRGTITFLPDFLQLSSQLAQLRLLGKDIPPGRWIYSAILLLGVVGEYTGGVLGERMDSELALVCLFLVITILSPLLGVFAGWALFVLAALFGFVMFVFPPLLQSLVAVYSPESRRGFGYGLTSSGNLAFGGFVGTTAAGWLVTANGYPMMFSALALFPLASVIVIVAFRVSKR